MPDDPRTKIINGRRMRPSSRVAGGWEEDAGGDEGIEAKDASSGRLNATRAPTIREKGEKELAADEARGGIAGAAARNERGRREREKAGR